MGMERRSRIMGSYTWWHFVVWSDRIGRRRDGWRWRWNMGYGMAVICFVSNVLGWMEEELNE